MNRQTTLVLGIVAAALAVYIIAFERHTLSSGELEGRSQRLLETFVQERVERLELEHGKQRIVLVRERAEDGELGEWRLIEPVKAPADQDAVSAIMSTLGWEDPRRVLEDVSKKDLTRFGLDEPAIEVRYQAGAEAGTLVIGSADAPSGGRYATRSDPSTVYVVRAELVDELAEDAWHFRSKSLFDGPAATGANRLRVEAAAGEAVASSPVAGAAPATGEGAPAAVRIVRERGRWWLREPVRGWASDGRVEAALRALGGLEATRLVTDEPASLREYGLDEPRLRAVAARPKGEPDDAPEPFEHVLAVGGPCGEHASERYARAGADGPVVCVEDEALEPLRAPVDGWRERRLLTADALDVDQVELESGKARLAVERTEDGWRDASAEGDEAGGDEDGSEVDDGAVTAWLDALRKAQADRFVPVEEGGWGARGLASPRATLTVRDDVGETVQTVQLGAREGEGVWVRRGEEPVATWFSAEAEALFDPSPVRLRGRALIREPDSAAVRVTVEREGGLEEIERKDEGWVMVRPAGAQVDPLAARDLVRRMGSLDAERFVTADPGPEHGLRNPRVVVRARFEGERPGDEEGRADGGSAQAPAGPRAHVLRVGAGAPGGGAYAQLDEDPAVFVVSDELVQRIESPLAAPSQAAQQP